MNTTLRTDFLNSLTDDPKGAPDSVCVRLSDFGSPLGPMIAGATEQGICLLEFAEPSRAEAQLASLRKFFGMPLVQGSNRHLERLEPELACYFAGALREFSVPLVFPGTPFQERVWRQLLTIPYGATRSYEALAAAVGDKKAVRAVGRANGQNRLAILIPCHRVINKSGALGGYGGGLPRKQFLLELEERKEAGAKEPRTH